VSAAAHCAHETVKLLCREMPDNSAAFTASEQRRSLSLAD